MKKNRQLAYPWLAVLGLGLLSRLPVAAQVSPAALPDLNISRGGVVQAIAKQEDGKLIIGGKFDAVNGVPRAGIARLNLNGSVDATWNPGTSYGTAAAGQVNALVIQGTDVYVGGLFQGMGGLARRNLGKLSTTNSGAADPTWNPDPGGGGYVNALALSGSSLYVGGSFLSIGGLIRTNLAKVNTTGSGAADPTWNANANDVILSLSLAGNDLYVGGWFTLLGGVARSGIAKLSAVGSGTVDPTWNPGANGSVRGLQVAGTNVYVVGGFNTIGGQLRNYIARLSTTGSGAADAAWNPGANVSNSGYVYGLAVSETHAYVGGYFTNLGGWVRNHAAKLSLASPGAVDTAWNPDAGAVEAILVQTILLSGTQVYLGGSFETVNGQIALGLAKVDALVGAVDEAYPVQVERPGIVKTIARQPDGKLLLGGYFGQVGGLARRNLARVNADGTVDATWNPNPSFQTATFGVEALAIDGTNIYVGGEFIRIGGQDRSRLAKLSTTGSDAADPTWNPNVNGLVRSIAVSGTNVFLGGHFTSVGGRPRNRLAKISSAGAGAVDLNWNPGANSNVFTLAVSGPEVFAGGSFTTVGGANRNFLAKLGATGAGAVDPVWNPNANGAVATLALSGTNLFVGGGFSVIGLRSRNGLAKLSTTGTGGADADWNPNVSQGPFALAAAGSNVYVGGVFTAAGGLIRTNLAKLSATGTGAADPSWQHNAEGTVYALWVEGADVYAGGAFARIGGATRWGLAFLPVADAPSLFQNAGGTVFLARHAADGPEVTHFQVTAITGGGLFLNDGLTPVSAHDFITVAQGEAGLKFVPSGTNGTVTAVSAVNSTPAGAGAAATTLLLNVGPGVFRFGSAAYSVAENVGSFLVNVSKIGNQAASVLFNTLDLTAVTYNPSDDTGDYFVAGTLPLTLNFGSTETNKTVRVFVVDDLVWEGDKTFAARLSSPSLGGLAYPAVATITIVDDDLVGSPGSLTSSQLPVPLAPPPADGVLVMDLEPVSAQGQWRLVGETAWRNRGTAAEGLTTGNYVVEFKPVSGYRQPDRMTLPLAAGVTNRYPAYYLATAQVETGTLTVTLKPDEVATNATEALRGQWRRQGEARWRDSGEAITDLNAGYHIVEFKNIPNRATPPTQSVMVYGDQANEITVTYLYASIGTGSPPAVLSFGMATTNEPYLYNGQIQTDIGFGSGVVVKPRVVLTAAHLLFRDEALTYVTGARWFFQRHKGRYEPAPQSPRGWYVFEGYAAQRQADQSPGVSSPASQHLDAAAIYFAETAFSPNWPGRGGYGGFLASDESNNPWLASSRLKMLVGYPLGPIHETNQGRLHATAPMNVSFTRLYQRVFATADILSYPGNSGGPVYVQYDDGHYYPAGIYLGGSAQTLVRAIDREVVDLINRAEISASGAGNHTGGGVALWEPGVTASPFVPGLFVVHFLPADIAGQGAGWRVVDGTDPSWISHSGQYYPLIPGPFDIEFRPVRGYVTPAVRRVEVVADQTTTIQANYRRVRLLLPQKLLDGSFSMTLSGEPGRVYTVQRSESLTNWAALTTLTNLTGRTNVVDSRATNAARRFYRAWEQ